MKNLTDLREHLFDTIDKLKNGKIELEEAKAIATLSQTLINSAKVEIDYLRLQGGDKKDSKFLSIDAPSR